jgi:crotonobetainyl-CoA:carnitine CoA-transferase CaiB-like acyl-CoA transferase
MGKNGLDYKTVQQINPRMIYAEISGYGKTGPWKDKPGQDLLLQSMAGLAYTTGNGSNGPVPFGIAVTDILCGAQLVQGILGGLIRRQKTGTGALIEVSLMESLLDFQFELLTTYFTSNEQPQRSNVANGQPLLSAPYGIYATADGFIALAMMDIHQLAKAIGCTALNQFLKRDVFAERDAIKTILADYLFTQPTAFWLQRLHEDGLWAMEVLDWEQMTNTEAYQCLKMEQAVKVENGEIITTRCPIRINGKKIVSGKPAPQLGAHNEKVYDELIKDHN